MMQFFSYIFWPNPGNATYTSPKAIALLAFCFLLVAASFALSFWRKRMTNPQMRKLSRSWSTAGFWFGVTGLMLVIARVEQIQYVAMRFLWVVWLVLAALYLFLQIKRFRAQYYEVLPATSSIDPRARYLPKKKK